MEETFNLTNLSLNIKLLIFSMHLVEETYGYQCSCAVHGSRANDMSDYDNEQTVGTGISLHRREPIPKGHYDGKECFDSECMCNENSIPDPCHSIPSSPFEIIPGLQSLLSMYTDETNCCMSKPTSSGSACATVSESHVPLRRDYHALYNDSIPQCFSSIPTDYSHR